MRNLLEINLYLNKYVSYTVCIPFLLLVACLSAFQLSSRANAHRPDLRQVLYQLI
jgi:hypothetical protein